jgi:uncharacterized membrane protein (UPF0127 family)
MRDGRSRALPEGTAPGSRRVTMGNVRRSIGLVVVLVLCAGCSGGVAPGTSERPALVVSTETGDVRFDVEVADDPDERATGLMDRASLPEDAGMVFLWSEPVGYPFWMKDTRIPLSILFWDADRTVVAILDMRPCAGEPCPTYSPGVEYVGALEVNRGVLEQRGVRIGDHVRLVGIEAA